MQIPHRALPLLLLLACFVPVAGAQIEHQLTVSLTPKEAKLQVTDRITLPASWPASSGFSLHAGLQPKCLTQGVTLTLLMFEPQPKKQKIPPVENYRIDLPKGVRTFTLSYAGKIDHPLRTRGKEHARSFRETPGLISTEGVYLSSSSYWFPRFDKALVTFRLDVQLPAEMDVVSQGNRPLHVVRESRRHVRWQTSKPQDDIYLIAARFHEYRRQAGAVLAMAFLRRPDPALASRYLEATARYVEMYRRLLGPYPYTKFALVENFWESGYGMPSFTLLGPRVIRLPFILHSSYPHEILHNWWGNGVFVDYPTGNWCEGLTAYLADHLIAEQRGRAVSYRRSSLQGYTDYAAEGRDFPLSAFRSRHSAATQAVGYGKCLMLFHMLRRQLGDELFIRALRSFYRTHRARRASFEDLRKSFSEVAKVDLRATFAQWVTRTGAPSLALSSARVQPAGNQFVLTGIIEQRQPGKPYQLRVPIAVWLAGQQQVFETTLEMEDKRLSFSMTFDARPVRIQLDPRFDLFRKLDRREIPPALSQMFGARRPLLVLPAAAPAPLLAAYRKLAASWKLADVTDDAQLKTLPKDRSIWLLGWRNRFLKQIQPNKTLRLANQRIDPQRRSAVLVRRHPANPKLALGWVGAQNVKAVAGLARKLPHYGKYSYLAFEGDAPTNVIKGQWQVTDAPTTIALGGRPAVGATLKPHPALASLPPVFDARRMLRDIAHLASPKLAGRGLGSTELDQAAAYIAQSFRKAGLQPGGEKGYYQSWKAGKAQLKNVIAVLPGSRPAWQRQLVVLSAHYDHLGPGFPGADDNASGVALLLELARTWGRGWRPQNTVLLIAFSGEESGLLGSRHFVSQLQARCMAAINLDSVGRLGGRKLMVLGTGSATQWVHVFRGIGWVTGIETTQVSKDPGGSDQVAFHEAGIPAVQLFSGPHADYHRAGDTADKIDAAGLIKAATVVKEAIEYLAARPRPLTSTLKAGKKRPAAAAGARRVSLGTIPDFAYRGKGVRLSGVVPGSPAAKAGLKKGDIVVGLGGKPLKDLRAYAVALRGLRAGKPVTLQYRRGGKLLELTIAPVRR